MGKAVNIQDTFLNVVRKEKVPVTVFLTNGFQFRGTGSGFDSYIVVLICDNKQHFVYKHAISTIIPIKNIDIVEEQQDA